MAMKGFIFTTDMIIGLSLAIIIVLSFVSLEFESILPEKRYERLNYVADDIVNLLSHLKTRSVSDKPTVSELVQNGILDDDDMNNTVLDLIGSLWYSGNESLAENISREVLEPFNDTCINLTAEWQTIYSSCTATPSNVATRAAISSGYEIGRPVSGYIARALATRMSKTTTLIVKGDIVSSSVRRPAAGTNQNEVNLTYDLHIPTDAVLIDSYWFIEAAYTDNKFKAYINGVFIPGSAATGDVLLTDLNSYLQPGHNLLTVVYRYGSAGYEGGDDGASHFVLNYSTEEVRTLPSRDKLYFGNVFSNTSIKYKKPVFVAGVIKSLDVNVSLVATTANLSFKFEGKGYNISKKTVSNNNVYWNNTEIQDALAEYNISYSNLTTRYFYFVIEADDYHEREELGLRRAIFNTSYVGIDADYKIFTYGFIDITNIIPPYSYSDLEKINFYRRLVWRFNSTAFPLALDSQLAWYYKAGTDPEQNISANSMRLYQHPPDPLDDELARFSYINESNEIIGGMNFYNLNFTDDYAVNPFNSLVDYTFLIPSQVGYGNVFNTSLEAADDARERLLDLLSGYITAEEIAIENKSIGGIKWLWGPSLFKVSTWEI